MSRVLFILMLLTLAARPAESVSSPPNPSPIEHFRQMLALATEEREQMLQRWPESKRAVLRRKCEVYHKLPPAERERRLRMVELRFYLQPLMSLSTVDREPLLHQIPESFKPIVAERLELWDRLPGEVRQRMLENEMVLQYFARLQQSTPDQHPAILQHYNPEQRARLEKKLGEWHGLKPEERRSSYNQFNRFFELPPQEQQRTLEVLSEAERTEMEKTLAAFSKLSPAQRRLCVESFRKFANFSPAERQEFLRNAARWQSMSAQERQQWRTLVNHLPPTPEISIMPPPPVLPSPAVSNVLGN